MPVEVVLFLSHIVLVWICHQGYVRFLRLDEDYAFVLYSSIVYSKDQNSLFLDCLVELTLAKYLDLLFFSFFFVGKYFILIHLI